MVWFQDRVRRGSAANNSSAACLTASWREREAQNGARFREQNEWIQAAEASYAASARLMRFVCECGDLSCARMIELTRSEYESVRAASNRFAVAPNHENPESELIFSEYARFTVVDKITGPALQIARETDPRAGTLRDAPLPDAPFSDDTPSACRAGYRAHELTDPREESPVADELPVPDRWGTVSDPVSDFFERLGAARCGLEVGARVQTTGGCTGTLLAFASDAGEQIAWVELDDDPVDAERTGQPSAFAEHRNWSPFGVRDLLAAEAVVDR
jgi:hypothetical protein